MTTIQQQLDFQSELRENYDLNCRESLTTNRDPKQVVELLRDIHENLIAVRNWQLGHKTELCSDCNQPLTEHNRVNYAVAEGRIIVTRDEHVCDRCTEHRAENAKHQSAGI